MALYMPASARRRRLIVVAIVAVLAGLILGWTLGRATAPTVADQVSSARSQAQQLDARLRSLPFEYDKARSANSDMTAPGGPIAALDGVTTDAEALVARSIWLGQQGTDLTTTLHNVRAGAVSGGSSAEFQAAIDKAIAAIDYTFGVPPSSH